jgi:hypothetical protein
VGLIISGGDEIVLRYLFLTRLVYQILISATNDALRDCQNANRLGIVHNKPAERKCLERAGVEWFWVASSSRRYGRISVRIRGAWPRT